MDPKIILILVSLAAISQGLICYTTHGWTEDIFNGTEAEKCEGDVCIKGK